MHTLLISALFLGTAYAVPIQRTSNPIDPTLALQSKVHEKLSNPIDPTLALQSKVHEKLSQPKQWYADGPAEVKSELNSEFPTPASTTTNGEPAKEPGPGEVVDLMDWESKLGDNFRSFLSSVREKHGSSRKEEPMVPVAPQAHLTNPLDHSGMNWGTKRSVIPPKPKKGKPHKAAEEAKPVPEAEKENVEVTTQLDAEVTNKDFDELFSYYIAKHDTRGFQGFLDNILQPGSPPLKPKSWQSGPGALHRRDSSNHSTPWYSLTPKTDKKPAISINPGIFNRIAAEYKFNQNPTSINTKDSNIGGRLSGAKGFGGGGQALLARQTAGGRGKSGIVGEVGRRDVVPCGVACSA